MRARLPEKLGHRTIYRVHMGREPDSFHSYRDFDESLVVPDLFISGQNQPACRHLCTD